MKKSIMYGSIRCSILLAGILGTAQAAPYGPEGHATRWTQPNGEVVQLRVFGDEYYGRTETTDGYTVVRGNDKTYYYANLSQDGSLVPSGTRADDPAPAGLAKHLDLPAAVIGQVRQQNHAKYDGDREQRWNERVSAVRTIRDGADDSRAAKAAAKIQGAPFLGEKRGLTILVQFPDDSATSAADPIDFPTNRAKIIDYCNKPGYNEDGNDGSVMDYFYDQSLGKLTYTQSVTAIITLPRARNYYNWSDYPTNKVYRGNAGQTLLNDALTELEKANFSFSNLSKDANNQVYATNIFFAGPDSGEWSQGLWPHMSGLGGRNVGTQANPIIINRYQITNLENPSPVLGTFCHENGHLILGYPDLYDYQSDSAGAGNHCLMASGSFNNGGKTPSPINGFFKYVSGWSNLTDMTPAQFRTVNLTTTGNRAYRVLKSGSRTEYFLIENRGAGDKWANYSVDKGIAIWHIDETVSGNSDQQMTNALHYQVSLEQADGKFDLEKNVNGGDGNDLFDLNSPRFNDTTKPNSKWWDGTRSAVEVQVLSAVGATTRVLIGSVPPDTIILDSPNGGEVLYPAANYEINWRANIKGNVRIDLIKAGSFHSVLAANKANDGSFVWFVPASLPKTNDYTIRIQSLTNKVQATDISVAPFAITNATFPAGAAMPDGWSRPSFANNGWMVSKSAFYEGKSSLVSKPVGDGQIAGISYRSNFHAGTVGFYMKASSEQEFDLGRFYIDGEKMLLDGKKGVSGETGWVYFSFPVAAGTHTFTWTYEKDDSYLGQNDCVWLDGVAFPPTTQEISIQKPVGVEHVDRKTTQRFRDTAKGSTSAAQTFTIKNRGKANLTDIRIGLTGKDKGDFVVTGPAVKTLAPGRSTTFKIRFAPTAAGVRKAGIRIRSNDENEGNFALGLTGNGIGLPKIAVSEPTGNKLADDSGVRNFGITQVGTIGTTRTFKIRNAGDAGLTGLSLAKVGQGKADFSVSSLEATSLAPGETTTFKVTFKPSEKNERRAILRIASNDKKTGVFDINIVGTGAPKIKATAASVAAAPSGAGGIVDAVLGNQAVAGTSASTEVIGGRKYLSLTVTKTAGANAGTVEVSSNLLDWYSGSKHTTVLVDDATTLKVRDNTPVTPESKRYIRLR